MVHHSNQPQSFGDFHHGIYTGYNRLETKLTCSFSYYRSKGTSSSLPRWRRGTPLRETLFVRSQTGKAQVVPLLSILLQLQLHRRNRKDRRQAYSLLLQTTMEPLPPHGLLVLSSSKPLTDRTGHYRAEGRFSSTGTTGDTPFIGTLPLPDKDSSHDDMPCRTPLH